jgi:predicted alpha-1,6-mannanase (GH76 family)
MISSQITILRSEVCTINKKTKLIKIARKKLYIFRTRVYVHNLEALEDIIVDDVKEKKESTTTHYRILFCFNDGVELRLSDALYLKKEPLLELAAQLREFVGIKDTVDVSDDEVKSDEEGMEGDTKSHEQKKED